MLSYEFYGIRVNTGNSFIFNMCIQRKNKNKERNATLLSTTSDIMHKVCGTVTNNIANEYKQITIEQKKLT